MWKNSWGNSKIEMTSFILWGVMFGLVWMCNCFPRIGVQNNTIQETTTDSVKKTKCINFCMFHNCNYGTCLQDPSNCKTRCHCFEGFSGAQCDIQLHTTSVSPETELSRDNNNQHQPAEMRTNIGQIFAETATLDVSQTVGDNFEVYNSLEECDQRCNRGFCTLNETSIRCIPKNCPKGFACANGRCEYKNDRSFRCICAEGWVGDFCDSKCTLDCGKHGKCVMNHGTDTCVCDSTHTGKLCRTEMPKMTTLPEQKSYQYLQECKQDCTDLCIPLNNSFYCLPSGKNCPRGFPCLHYCYAGNNNMMRCICEPGWTGDMCTRQCSLNCSKHGSCYVDNTGRQMCLCDFSYRGKSCEQKVLGEWNSNWRDGLVKISQKIFKLNNSIKQ